MYRCDVCKGNIGPRVPQTKVVTQTREKRHEWGEEIVHEAIVCPICNPNKESDHGS